MALASKSYNTANNKNMNTCVGTCTWLSIYV